MSHPTLDDEHDASPSLVITLDLPGGWGTIPLAALIDILDRLEHDGIRPPAPPSKSPKRHAEHQADNPTTGDTISTTILNQRVAAMLTSVGQHEGVDVVHVVLGTDRTVRPIRDSRPGPRIGRPAVVATLVMIRLIPLTRRTAGYAAAGLSW